MNNLLRTLTESEVKSSLQETDLKLLLSTVKDGRHKYGEGKLSDPFYESLDGLLIDLRTITMDNHDPEAFLKPVAKSDYPDYYEIIDRPMDLQTMTKKVKNRVYKCKDDFEQDLNLIWDNCYIYNQGENHPLRQCVERLKAKAQKLLRNITDRRERTEPNLSFLPPGKRPMMNGASFRYTPSPVPNRPQPGKAIATTKSSTALTLLLRPPLPGRSSTKSFKDVPFAESPAIMRTTDGMTMFGQFDRQIEECEAGPSSGIRQSLSAFLGIPIQDQEHLPEGAIGDKRKPNGIPENNRPRKRLRTDIDPNADVVDLWWQAVATDELIGSGLPGIPGGITSHHTPIPHIRDPDASRKRKAANGGPLRKKKKRRPKPPPKDPAVSGKSLLGIMNTNIRTMKRVRRTHAHFSALNDPDGHGGSYGPMEEEPDTEDPGRLKPWIGAGSGIDMGEENAAKSLNWMGEKVLEHTGFQGASKAALDVLASVTAEYLLNVGRTMRYMSDKYPNKMTAEEIILHTLFESGTAKVQDLERYIKDDVIRYGSRLSDLDKKMTSAYREAATSGIVMDDEELFKEEEDEEKDGAFVMGDFTDAFGEDFLGLRALGIADEHGMSSLSVPKRLLKPKKKQPDPLAAEENKPLEPKLAFPLPPPFIPLASTRVEGQIGLLKSFYQTKVSAIQAATQPPPPPPVPVPEPTAPAPIVNDILPSTSMGPPSADSIGLPSTNHIGLPPTHSLGLPPLPPPPVPTPPLPAPSGPFIIPDDAPTPLQMKMGPVGVIVKAGASKSKQKSKKKEDPSRLKSEQPSKTEPLPDTPQPGPPGTPGGLAVPDPVVKVKKKYPKKPKIKPRGAPPVMA